MRLEQILMNIVCLQCEAVSLIKKYRKTYMYYIYIHTERNSSLVPRPSNCPVLDHLQYAKNGGRRPSQFYHIMTCLPRQTERGVVPNRKNAFHARVLCFKP